MPYLSTSNGSDGGDAALRGVGALPIGQADMRSSVLPPFAPSILTGNGGRMKRDNGGGSENGNSYSEINDTESFENR